MFKRIALLFAFISLLFLSIIYLNLNYYINAQGSNNKPVNIIIKHGFSVKQIGKELVRHKIISSSKVFYLIHKLCFKSISLKAGEYEIPPHATLHNIFRIMNKGIVVVHKLVIPEGITHKEIMTKILNEPLLKGDITQEYSEGDFLADTYHYIYGETKMDLINRVYYKSQLVIDDLWKNRQENLPLKDKKEAVALASIIEKETGIASEKRKIAAVFINRLNKQMRLQADPTVIYAVTKGKEPFLRSISKSDLKLDSPYNTYVYNGLPPTAIASPGKDALYAALHPENTKDLYFVANGNGGHNFSANLSDHNNHVRNYRNVN